MDTSEASVAVDFPPLDLDAAGHQHTGFRRTADRVFWGAFAFTAAITLVCLFFAFTKRDGGAFFGRIQISLPWLGQILAGFLIMSVFWGWIWYHAKRFLLRRFVGFSKEETKLVFTSRMNQPFDLAGLLDRHSERRIRIVDMIGRRGRFIMLQLASYIGLYLMIAKDPKPEFLTQGLQGNLLDAVFFSWLTLAAYYSDGFFGRTVLGSQSRIMDGTLARANCLLISTLWNGFKFVMVPIGFQLTKHFPPATYATLFVFIWLSYVSGDALSEIIGSLFGKQKLRVWGMGEINRKSVAGTWACFVGSLVPCLFMVWINHLPLPWLGLAFGIAVATTFTELFSPRGTDDFTMATVNALICWGFGVAFL